MTDEAKKNFTMRITQANKSGLVVILYEMYLTYLEDAENAVKDRQEFRLALRRARGCLDELLDSLDFNYELSYQLLQLYVYANKEMALADAKGKAEPLKVCRKIMEGLLYAYREVSKQDMSVPVMENAQEVYAGLTYGKGQLTESLAHQGNRGFLV